MDSATLTAYRANKDEYFRTDHQSPIPMQYRDQFDGLSYYDWNPDLVFTVPVVAGTGDPVTIATSDGAQRRYHHAGTVEVSISGEQVQLSLYTTGHPGFFLPFRDATSGKKTYGAGRYLDLQPNADGTVTIDFNLAYSPFCAYSDSYSCALPPSDNWLTVAIEAGERTWDKPG
jgi:uncharacterized protein (DUF1684 family)